MKKILPFICLLFLLSGCESIQPALSVDQSEIYPVKGRQGLLIKQKLKFGEYHTSPVKRSWTRGGNTRIDLLSGQVHNPSYPNLVSLDYVNKNQAYYFQMNDGSGNVSDAYAATAFH